MYINQSRFLLDLRFPGILLFILEARFRRKTLKFLEDAHFEFEVQQQNETYPIVHNTSLKVESVTDMANEKTDCYTQLSSQIQEKFLANQQTQKIYDQKDTWRVEMELIIQELYPNCRLVLCGSSANGFGSIDSDTDLVLSVGEGESSAVPYMLRRIESLFTRKPRRFETKVNL